MRYIKHSGITLALSIFCGCQNTQIYRGDGYEITYPPAEKSFAQQIVNETKFPITISNVDAFKASAAKWKDDDLALIAYNLGLNEPSEGMTNIFDTFVRIQATMVPQISAIDIYYYEDLKKKLKNGVKIDALSYNPTTDKIDLKLSFSITDEKITQKFQRLPVILKAETLNDLQSRMREFNKMVEGLKRFREGQSPLSPYFVTLHETVESEIVFSMIKSPDRRWFADGMANAISLLVMQARNPEKNLENLLSIYYPAPANLAEILDSIDLESWEASENETREYPQNAYYHLATLAVLEMIKENGKEFIPKLFRELRSYDYETIDMKIIYEIFQKQTGNDMIRYIPKVKKRIVEAKQQTLP